MKLIAKQTIRIPHQESKELSELIGMVRQVYLRDADRVAWWWAYRLAEGGLYEALKAGGLPGPA